MKNILAIVYILVVLAFTGCSDNSILSDKDKEIVHVSQPTDTLYTEKTVMDIYAFYPKRALLIIDSAEIVGNLTPLRADLLRAIVYARTDKEMNYDSAILIAERLMYHDSVMANPDLQEDVLDVLLNACRLQRDDEQALYWATQLVDLYLRQADKTEALRTNAEIGTFLIRIGQQEEGLAKIDNVIQQLNDKQTFNEFDALIIALKRKAEICNEKGLYHEVVPVAQRMLDLLDDYEQHPDDFHDGSFREPSKTERPEYIDFYRGKAYAYLAGAYSSLELGVESEEFADARRKAREYLAFYEQTTASSGITGRFMIAPILRRLGEYDQMLAIYDEIEPKFGDDTMNANYVEILRGRAEAADMQGRLTEAKDYWKRYATLNKQLTENLLQGKAHLYAARFHAQEQQHEIEQQREATRRAVISRTTISIISLLILLFAFYVIRQWYKTLHRNRILAQQITEAAEYKEKYKELKRFIEAKDSGEIAFHPQGEGLSHDTQIANSAESVPSITNPADLSDADLFVYLRDLIEHEKLFLNPHFERQILIDRTGLSKERIGAAFAQGSDHERLTTLIRELRLDYAVRLMNEHPEFTVEQVCQASGFANADTFTRNFKAKYGMTPTAYRGVLR